MGTKVMLESCVEERNREQKGAEIETKLRQLLRRQAVPSS